MITRLENEYFLNLIRKGEIRVGMTRAQLHQFLPLGAGIFEVYGDNRLYRSYILQYNNLFFEFTKVTKRSKEEQELVSVTEKHL